MSRHVLPLALVRSLFVGALMFCAAAVAAAELSRQSGVLAEGTRWETSYHVIDSGQPGPAVVIVGGVHGNEPAGAAAAEQIMHWTPLRGRLIVIPRANQPALQAQKRNTPDAPDGEGNLNRNFPKSGGPNDTRGELATAIWDFVVAQHPDWLLDLHEGYDFAQVNGSAISSARAAAMSGTAPGAIWPPADTIGGWPSSTRTRSTASIGGAEPAR